jgi:hypothetical protein
MRIVPLPRHDDESVERAWLIELESALSGDADGPAADSWREMRDDVRALAPPIAPDFEQRLRAQIAARGVRRWVPRLRVRPPARPAIAAIACVLCAALVALVVVAPWRSAQGSREATAQSRRVDELGTSGPITSSPSAAAGSPVARHKAAEQVSPSASTAAGSSSSESSSAEPSSNAPAFAPGRVQQLGASVTLAVAPTDVQQTADRVSRLVVHDGGFVQSSHVQVQQGSAGEANLMLKLPSEKLNAALASLEQIAPVREESQSLQDITNTYNAARQRLSDVEAERRALLHALADATTEGQIDSLRERLAQSRSALGGAHSALAAVSRRASTAEVEVSVIGNAHAPSEGLTLHRGLHDAGRVLTVVLVVLLIAATVLIPLALVLLALVLAGRAWRRHRREQALDTQ